MSRQIYSLEDEYEEEAKTTGDTAAKNTSQSKEAMGRMSLETRAKVIRLKKRGMPVQQIAKHLDSEGVDVSKVSLYALFKKYKATHCIQDQK